MFAIAWEYLLDKAFAATWADRNAPEWPPHPDRVFQALVAAWGETGQEPTARAALEWLERQGPPALTVPPAIVSQPSDAYVAVPANDDQTGQGLLELLASARHHSLRTFPATTVAAPVTLTWAEAEPQAGTLAALRELCARVTHVGSSRSLVRMWVVDEDAIPEPTLLPDPEGETSLRVPVKGRLAALEQAYADGGENWRRPPCAPWRRYREAGAAALPASAFAADWTVLKIVGRSEFDLAQSPAVAAALRDTLIKGADGMPTAMRLISGHTDDGSPLTVPHLAVAPLGFVGNEHADGHLLGAALILPRDADYADRDGCLRALIKMTNKENDCLTLNFGKAGTLSLELDAREPGARPAALNPETWCRPAKRWASVTPIACDRLPPRRAQYDAWAAEQVALACERIGLPRPVAVEVGGASAFIGAPACKPYPPLRSRDGRTPRWHLHAIMTFREPVRGPLLLGAGRYRGYGLCRPLPFAKED